MDRTGDEFPERLELLEHRRIGIVIVSGGVVHVGGQPDGVTDARMLDEGEKVADLDFPPARWAVSLSHRIGAHDADRQVGGDKDRKSTRLNSSHLGISYAVFCLKKKK